MPTVTCSIDVDLPPDEAFAVSQTQGAIRYRWDPFVKEQRLLDAAAPAKGVRTLTRSSSRLTMTSEYVSFRPPNQVGMKMIEGPWFFKSFGGGWSFKPATDGQGTTATWRYTFKGRPSVLAPLIEAIGVRVLRRQIQRRIEGFGAGCRDAIVLAAIRGSTDGDTVDQTAVGEPPGPATMGR